MKMFSKTEDGEIDCMLRAHVGRRSEHGSLCREFDPDLASAFVEHSLTPGEQSRYESHLAACHSCRSSVIALARMADESYAPAQREPAPARDKIARGARAGFGAWLVGWFGPLSPRQLVPAAVAFLVVTVSLPLLFFRKDSPPEQNVYQAEATASQDQLSQDQRNGGTGSAPAASSAPDNRTVIARAEAEKSSEPAGSSQPEPSARETSGAAPIDQPVPATPPPTEKVEAAVIAEESSRNVAGGAQLPSAPAESAPAPRAEEKKEAEEQKLARIDETTSLRVPGDNKGSAEMIVVKPGVYSGAQSSGRITTNTITPKDAIAPPASSSNDPLRRRLASRNPEGDSRSRNSSDAARLRGTANRKIGSKTFWLVKGVWTDNKYNPEKEQPAITVYRDSDIYNDMLEKHGGLKVFFTAFPADERVTVVYKDTVYKLVPRAK